ncbi:Solute carrier organic anion transporter member 4A1 [Schistosoma haematobium]|uniref:Solute carrier organic anion transporter member 4A1 n=2 Tax=Schistosoma TaxID=6181 RepID=A0A922IHS1_SCHHA|nr:Solute carrier organic anion transporter member 4A1 [Schistosoma haematobium]KAH9579490.1 Solute carrier organic anion transporter member 4A1 [Schistosoma haematobium]
MPTPHLSRATSGPSSGYAVGDEICDTSCPIDWDTNVVNFISTCLHPGLVRRTSSSATYGFDKPNHFRRQHRRNLSTATTVGSGRYPDNQITSGRVPYANVFNHPNDYQAPPPYYSKRILGHARNISDPTSGWDFRIVTKPLILDQLTERPSYNWDGSAEQNLVVSGEYKIPDTSFIPENKAEAYPCLTPPRSSNDITLENSFICARDAETHGTTTTAKDDTSCLCPCLQTCANPRVVLIGLCLTMFMQTMVVSGLMSSMFTTLERRFNLTSRQIGSMISCYEVAGVITTVIVSFISGQKHNRLRVIGLATLILALGFGLFALPHFIAGPYRPNLPTTPDGNTATSISTEDIIHSSLSSFPLNQDLENSIQLDGPLCVDQSRNTFPKNVISNSLNNQTSVGDTSIRAAPLTAADNVNSNDINESSSTGFMGSSDIVQSVLFPTFCFAMLLAGIGASPLYVLAPTYLWDNLTDRQYPIYAALFYSAGGLGPACGFLAGAGFLSIYIDSPFMLPETGLDRNSPLWLGAWWLGMLVCAALTFFVALPVICFPKQLAVIKKSDSNTIPNDETEDLDKICSPTIQSNNHNISNLNTNNNKVNLSYVKSSDNLPNINKQFGQPSLTTTTTAVSAAAVAGVETLTSNHLLNTLSPDSRNVQYPSLEEFKQQQRLPEMKRNHADSLKTSPYSPTTITPNSLYAQSPSIKDAVISGDGTIVSPSNQHFRSHSNIGGGHLDSLDGNTVEVVNNGIAGCGDQSDNLGKFMKTSLNNSFSENQANLKSKIKASYHIVRRVLTNPVWLGVTLSTVVEQSIVAAFLAFAAKYIQILFHIPAYLASIHTGAVIVPSSLLGVLSGALLMRHFRPTLHRTLSGLCIMISLTVITSISLMSIGCQSSRVAGITATYNGEK